MKLDAELVGILMRLGDSINCTKNAQKAIIMQKLAKDIYEGFVKGQDGVKPVLLGSKQSFFALMLLGHLLGDCPEDRELFDVLVERSKEEAFNDRCETALFSIRFYRSFFH